MNVVLAISSKCKFCKESIPLYHQIRASQQEPGSKMSLAVISSESQADLLALLSDQGLTADQTYHVALSSVGISATPTVLVVDSHGIVRDMFVGMLEGSRQAQLLKSLAAARKNGWQAG